MNPDEEVIMTLTPEDRDRILKTLTVVADEVEHDAKGFAASRTKDVLLGEVNALRQIVRRNTPDEGVWTHLNPSHMLRASDVESNLRNGY